MRNGEMLTEIALDNLWYSIFHLFFAFFYHTGCLPDYCNFSVFFVVFSVISNRYEIKSLFTENTARVQCTLQPVHSNPVVVNLTYYSLHIRISGNFLILWIGQLFEHPVVCRYIRAGNLSVLLVWKSLRVGMDSSQHLTSSWTHPSHWKILIPPGFSCCT